MTSTKTASFDTQQKLGKYLEDPKTFATSLVAICIDAYSTECFSWEPSMLVAELEEDFSVQIPQANRDKVSALILALTTDSFYTDPSVFWQIANVLSGAAANFQSGQDLMTAEEAAWAAVEVTLNDVSDEKEPTPGVSEDVARLVGLVLKQEGFSRAPTFLKWADLPRRGPEVMLDQQTEEAVATRSARLEESLVAEVQDRVRRLNVELQRLPLAGRQAPSPEGPLKGFLAQQSA